MTTRYPVIDGHNDTLLRALEDPTVFLERNGSGHIDLPRAREGGLVGGFCAMFTPRGEEDMSGSGDMPPTPDLASALAHTMRMFSLLLHLERASQGALRIVRTVADMEACVDAGGFGAIAHIEGAEAIDADLDSLHVLHAAGLRSLGPVWSRRNIFGEGVPFAWQRTPDTGPGLTESGKRLVRACNDLGILIDLSHLTEAGFWDVASISRAPLVATHSNVWTLSPATRNLTDRQLDAIRDSDGMVGINFCVAFLREDCGRDTDTPLVTMVSHVQYLADRIGIDRVGFGSDFDGAEIPDEVGDATGLPRLLEALAAAGFDDASLRKIAFENWLRVLRLTWPA